MALWNIDIRALQAAQSGTDPERVNGRIAYLKESIRESERVTKDHKNELKTLQKSLDSFAKKVSI